MGIHFEKDGGRIRFFFEVRNEGSLAWVQKGLGVAKVMEFWVRVLS